VSGVDTAAAVPAGAGTWAGGSMIVEEGTLREARGGVQVWGRYRVKVLPLLGVLLRRISPPSRRDSSRLMARPRPVPPYLRLVEPSACWKASKMICCFSLGMPMPVSLTEIAITERAWL